MGRIRVHLMPHGRAAFQSHALVLEHIVAAARTEPGH
ncbi:hypothetical protein ACRB68_69770 [Actinomadura sp. RB68]|uniref:Uncharacterized protein n=1 Tax=Actinomadura macrotermitis TaxID=2585200 RepID=A0A7K0C6A2_9ACTN|nr:hypothetical protein [Actinomadura macrotermitis]